METVSQQECTSSQNTNKNKDNITSIYIGLNVQQSLLTVWTTLARKWTS